MRTFSDIKICGLRRVEDAVEISKYPCIKYAGLVFFKKSKRLVTKEEARDIVKALREGIQAVGVFAENTAEEIKEIADYAGLDILQLHSDEDEDFCKKLEGYRLWKALRIGGERNYPEIQDIPNIEGYVLDAYTKGYGGSGKTFDWTVAKEFAKEHFTVLAGGISSSNILEAYKTVKPNVIDLSSSVETEGYKDYNKIYELTEKIKEAENFE